MNLQSLEKFHNLLMSIPTHKLLHMNLIAWGSAMCMHEFTGLETRYDVLRIGRLQDALNPACKTHPTT